MKSFFHPTSIIGFGLTSAFAVVEKWSLQEFCWSTWLAALVYSWACVITAAIQILVTARKEKGAYEISMPFLKRVSPTGFLFGITLAAALIGWLALYGYRYLIGKFWPMILGTLIANGHDFIQDKTWKRILLPFRSNEILRIHILTLALPFLTLIAWALFRTAYQPVTLVLLIGLFYLLPKKRQKIEQTEH